LKKQTIFLMESQKNYDFCGKQVRGRFAFPSGIVATTIDTARLMLKEVPEIGVYESKVIMINPEQGNPEDILCQMDLGTFVNAVKFANPGLEEMIQEIGELRESSGKDIFIMPQIGEAMPEEFAHCIREFERANIADGYSLNLSCPHAKARGITVGKNPDSVYEVFRELRKITDKPLFIKAGADFEEQIRSALKGGATGAIAINTLRCDAPELYNEFGGMSGEQLFPVAAENARRIRSAFGNIPVIVEGGIGKALQIRMLDSELEGLFYGIGTRLAGMTTQQIIKYFHALQKDIDNGTDNAEKLAIDRMMMEYRLFIVKEVESYGKDIALVKFYEHLDAGPGQFVFVKTDNKHSKPFSVADDSEGLEIVVRGIGETSRKIIELKPNSIVRIRGPYGAEF
jgi:dihydroorotate dehydrogenase (NAD+) catalytic subunit